MNPLLDAYLVLTVVVVWCSLMFLQFRKGRWMWPGIILTLLAALSNKVTRIANGGYMPVLGLDEAAGHWVPLTDSSRLPWLADRFWGASIGDFLVDAALLWFIIALLVWVIMWLLRRKKPHATVQLRPGP